MNLRSTRGRDDPEINFIPLIDVLLVILIFLMVTTTYQRIAELQITLPEADAEQVKQRPKEINVGIDAQGRYVVDKTPFTFTNSLRAGRPPAARGRRRQGSGHRDQRRRERDAPIRDPRDGSRADRGLRPHHVRDAVAGQVMDLRIPASMSVASRLVAAWYRPRLTALTLPLVPAALAFGAIANARRALYRGAVLHAERLPVPVVVVGNITVGGSGKTPLAAALARALAERGWHPGIVSRGHGRADEGGPRRLVAPDADPSTVGDEPVAPRAHGRAGCRGPRSRGRSASVARRPSRLQRARRRRRAAALSTCARLRDRRRRCERAAWVTDGDCPQGRCASPCAGSRRRTRSSRWARRRHRSRPMRGG